jgi:hypothetical protein
VLVEVVLPNVADEHEANDPEEHGVQVEEPPSTPISPVGQAYAGSRCMFRTWCAASLVITTLSLLDLEWTVSSWPEGYR